MTRLLGSCLLRIGGWRIRGALPPHPKLIVVIAPHTSNWDFVWLLMAKWRLGLSPRWLGKHTLFRAPLGWLMRALGGIPVDRGKREDRVDQAVAAFRRTQHLALAIAPEGTRRRTAHWKSGFRSIALATGVPVVPVALDYGRREIVMGEPLKMTDDGARDMSRLRDFFQHRRGRHPGKQGPIRLKRSG